MKRSILGFCTLLAALALPTGGIAADSPPKPPVVVAVSAEYGVQGSHAAQSIEKGVALAISEINAAGGVLGGRSLVVEGIDDRGLPARAIDNLVKLAARPEVVAVFCGRFSPVAIELVPIASRERILFLDPWAAADGIANNGTKPNYVFRLSITDTWAMEKMLRHARQRGHRNLGLVLPNTGWGRSSLAAASQFANRNPGTNFSVHWYNWGDRDFLDLIRKLKAESVQAMILVANEGEGSEIVKALAGFPKEQRIPVISHWGVAGGDFVAKAGPALNEVDFVVAQSFTFFGNNSPRSLEVAARYEKMFGTSVQQLRAQVGFAHAYDFTHLLARAINKAGTTDREAVRRALENLGRHEGLVRTYGRPFTPNNHEALGPEQVFMARFVASGELQAVGQGRK